MVVVDAAVRERFDKNIFNFIENDILTLYLIKREQKISLPNSLSKLLSNVVQSKWDIGRPSKKSQHTLTRYVGCGTRWRKKKCINNVKEMK